MNMQKFYSIKQSMSSTFFVRFMSLYVIGITIITIYYKDVL